MSDLLNSRLTEQLRTFAHGDGKFAIFTGNSLRGGRLIDPTRRLIESFGERVVGVVDQGADVNILGDLEGWEWAPDIPVTSDPAVVLAPGDALVIGLALPRGKVLRPSHADVIRGVANAGHLVFSGLERPVPHPNVLDLCAFGPDEHIQDVGRSISSVRVGLYQTTVESSSPHIAQRLADALGSCGRTADWLPSSPTGMLMRGFGRSIDRAPGVFAPRLTAELLEVIEPQAEIVVVEGSGSLLDSTEAGLCFSQALGSQPSFHLIVHKPQPATQASPSAPASGGPSTKGVPSPIDPLVEGLDDLIHQIDGLHAACKTRSTLVGVVVDTEPLDEWSARQLCAAIGDHGLICADLQRDGVTQLARALDALCVPRW